MIRMRMIEADNILAPLARRLLRRKQLFVIDEVAIMGGIRSHVAAADGEADAALIDV